MMAICHTAVPERADGKITYQAASPGTSHLYEHSYYRISVIQLVIIYSLVCVCTGWESYYIPD